MMEHRGGSASSTRSSNTDIFWPCHIGITFQRHSSGHLHAKGPCDYPTFWTVYVSRTPSVRPTRPRRTSPARKLCRFASTAHEADFLLYVRKQVNDRTEALELQLGMHWEVIVFTKVTLVAELEKQYGPHRKTSTRVSHVGAVYV
jgi:hypothetical protein